MEYSFLAFDIFRLFSVYILRSLKYVQIVNWIFFNLNAYYYATTFYKN